MNIDGEVKSILQYSRRSYKEAKANDSFSYPVENIKQQYKEDDYKKLTFPRSGISEQQAEIVKIIHKKCPIINLAQEQINKFIDDDAQQTLEDTFQRRQQMMVIFFNFFNSSKLLLYGFVLMILTFLSFISGTVMGAASCGIRKNKFVSPWLNCINNFLINISPENSDTYRAIV